jgi:SP family galactose:H+ symporter-like MFS transporter
MARGASRRAPLLFVASPLLFVLGAMSPTATAAALTPQSQPRASAQMPSLRQRTAGLRVAAGAALGNLLQGFNTGIVAGALIRIVPEFHLEARPELVGLIASSTTMGAVVGTSVSGRLSDAYGRQKALVLSSALFLTGGALMGWSPTPSALIAGRFIGGMAAGLVSAAVPTYIAECAEPSQRGALATLPQLCVSSGILLSYLVALGSLLLGGSWRLMLGLSLLPALCQAFVVLSLPESPRWTLTHKPGALGTEEAASALRRLRGKDDVGEELAQMKAGLAAEGSARPAAGGSGGDAAVSAAPPSLATLVQNPQARRALLVCSALQLFQQFCGVNAIVYFTPQILKQAGAPSLFASWGVSSDAAAMLATVLAYLPKIPSVLLATYLIDRKGRRWMLNAFIPPLALCLAVLALSVGSGLGAGGAAAAASTASSAAAATAAVTLFGVFFGMSLGPLPNILAAELFPTSVRAPGVAATTTVQWLSNMLVAALFPVLTAKFGMSQVLNGFALVCVLAWLVVLAYVPETKGLALESIGAGSADQRGKKGQ